MFYIVQAIGLLGSAYAAYYLVSVVYFVFFHRLSKFPGPKPWAASRIPYAWHTVKGDIWKVQQDLHAKYGPIVRIAPDEIITTLPGAWRDLYACQPLLLKDPDSQTPPLNGAHSLFTAEGSTHRRIRKVLANSFSDKSLRNQDPLICGYAEQFLSRVIREGKSTQGGAIDLTKLYGYAAFDIITDLSLGEPLARGLEGNTEHDWLKNYFFHAQFSAIRIALSRFSPLDTILGLFLFTVTRKARQRNWKVITGALNRRLATDPEKRSDLLTPLVDRIDEGLVTGITRAEVTSNSLAFVIAGTQLTTNILSTATYMGLCNPAHWKRVVNEVRGRFKTTDEIHVDSMRDLVYLRAFLDEVLRIRHPTPINLPRIVPASGHVVDGEFIPGNVLVGVNLQNIQNDPSLWVEPRTFHPERFLAADHDFYNARFEADVKEACAPFSVGQRNCIGSKLFFAVVEVLIARLVLKFDLEPRDDLVAQNWLESKAWFAFEPRPLMVKLVPCSN